MSIVTDNWSKIWNGKQADEQLLNRDFETVFMELYDRGEWSNL